MVVSSGQSVIYAKGYLSLTPWPKMWIALFLLAAVLEISGCFAIWAVARLHASPLWLVPGIAALALFGWILTQVDADAAGRTFASYGGIYIVASLGWLSLVEGRSLDRFDLIGGAICLVGAAVILLGPRG